MAQKELFIQEFPEIIFEEKKHHISHAYSLYAFTENKESDLIVSFDGGGDMRDYFKLFTWVNGRIELFKEVSLNLGAPFKILGLITDEIKSTRTFEYGTNLHLPGKIMGLAALGKTRDKYINAIRQFYLKFSKNNPDIYESLKFLLKYLMVSHNNDLKIEKNCARDILCTSQKVFEDLFFENAQELFLSRFDRILLVGGCSLNVKLNSVLYQEVKKEVFVSPVSGDCGISLGAALSDINLDVFNTFKNAFIGTSYMGDLSSYISTYNPKNINLQELAELLAQGKIVATVVGRVEAGARSLGNRSILASPLTNGIRDKLNIIKGREFFRPVAPIVTDKSQNVYFENSPHSKFMTFAPKIRPKYKIKLKEIVHFDDTCRIQTVTSDDYFIYPLLLNFGKITNVEVLVNTSFNVNGKPILNDLYDAFVLLETSGIDCLYIDGLLFEKS